MCVDDYEFRHFSAMREKICKRFVFLTEEDLERVFLVNISQFQRYDNLCLCEILMHLNKKGLNIKDYRFYLPKFDVTIEAGDRCQVPFEMFTADKDLLFEMQWIEDESLEPYSDMYGTHKTCETEMDEERTVLVKRQLHDESEGKDSLIGEKESQEESIEEEYTPHTNSWNPSKKQNRKSKQQQKTVREALFLTKKWRWYYEKLNLSLKNSAMFVGLSKKTLDDYFLVLRVARVHGYNFKEHLDKKIGHMRAFIRDQPVRIKGRISKIFACFELVPDPDLTEVTDKMKLKLTKMEHIEPEPASLSTNSSKSRKEKENEDDHEMIPE